MGATDGPGTEGTADADVGWQTGLGGHQGQVGHRSRQVQREFRLDTPEVAGLADSHDYQRHLELATNTTCHRGRWGWDNLQLCCRALFC